MSGFPRTAPTFRIDEAPSNYKAGMGRGGKGGLGFSTRGDIGPASVVPGAIRGGRGPTAIAGVPEGVGTGGLYVDSKFGVAPKGYVAGRGRGMGALARENGELPGEQSFGKPSSGYEYQDRLHSGAAGVDPYDQDDDEADQIYANVDQVMTERHKRKSLLKDRESKTRDPKKTKISEQFVDLKQNLGSLTATDWDAIPEVGDSSLKYTQQHRFRNVYVPLPDSIISRNASQLSGADDFAANDLTDADVVGVDSAAALSKGRTDGLVNKLDRMSDSVSGQMMADPRGYMTNLDSLTTSALTEINDVKKARMLLGSVITSNPKHAPGWMAAARVEEIAGKINSARKIIKQGCEECPHSEDLWLERARLNSGDDAKAVLAEAVQHMPTSVSLWKKAASLEESKSNKLIVFRKALEHVTDSAELWKCAIDLESSADDARIMLERAIECVPQCVDLWLALAKLETYENAKNVLNRARETLPHERSIWITAASLEEAYEHNQLVDNIISKMVSFLSKDAIITDRQDWIRDAQKAEVSQSLIVCNSLVKHTIGLDVEDEDRLVTWMEDAESCLCAESFCADGQKTAYKHTARAIYNHALGIFPTKHVLWLGLAALENQHGAPEDLAVVLERAVEQCPNTELLWLMAAKHKWTTMKDVDAARDLLNKAICLNRDSEELWLAAGKLEWETLNVVRAKDIYFKGREALPSKPRLWMKSALVDMVSKNYEDALILIEEGMKKFPTFYKFYLMAAECCAAVRGDGADHNSTAGDFLRKGVSICLPPIKGHDVLSIALSRLEEIRFGANKARTILELARVKCPKCQELWLEAIRLEHRQGNEALKEALLAQAKQECSGHCGLIWAEDLWTCSKPAFKSKSVDALKMCDNDPHIILIIARVFERDAKIDKARKWYQRACDIDPKLGDSWCYLYAFEVQQEAIKCKNGKDNKSGNVNSITALTEIEKACVDADPNKGELWNSFRKQISNRREPVAGILKGVVKKILSK